MPRIIGNLPADRWENEVLKGLRNQLPDDWVVMPSVKWTLKKNGYVRDGEADFVVLIPESGLVILEVKGSKEFKVGADGVWQRKQNDGSWFSLKEAPPEQATRNMYDLISVLKERQGWSDFPGRYAYMVVYPQGESSELPAMFDASTIATRRHMNSLRSRIRKSLEMRGRTTQAEKFSSHIIETIIDQLKNRAFVIQKVDTEDDVSSDVGQIEQLTRQQFASLKGLFQLPSVAVIGPAGSGKTVLAIWRLQALIDQGQTAVYVCYNRSLADALRLRHPDYADHIWNVDRLFLALHKNSHPDIGQPEFHRETLPSLIIDLAESGTYRKYDSIIVDEGQDLSEFQVIALLDLLSEDGLWAFFADWNQDLYKSGSSTPIGAEVIFHLHHNCRNAIKINDACNRYLGTSIDSMPGMPDGVRPLVEVVKNQSLRVWELARQWSGEGAVVILSPFKYENSSMAGEKRGHGLTLSTDIGDLGEKDTVIFSTIKSFKGIEASAIILVDALIPDDHLAFSREDLYVATTRATTRLAILTSNQSVADYFK